jgi:hypothetical protein
MEKYFRGPEMFPDAWKNTFGVQKCFPTGGKILSGFRKCFVEKKIKKNEDTKDLISYPSCLRVPVYLPAP